MALGLFLSAFASTEFQAVQFMPAFVLPQLLLCGLFVPREQMAGALDVAGGRAAPDLRVRRPRPRIERAGLVERVDARRRDPVRRVVLALALGAATLRRRTA